MRCLTFVTEPAEQGQGSDLPDALLPSYGACNLARIPSLVVLTSSGQLYSSTDVAIFKWIRYAKHIFDFAICIDNQIREYYVIARGFCITRGIAFLPSGTARVSGAPDPGVADSQIHVGSGRWPIIEIVRWANTSTNLDVINACQPGSMLSHCEAFGIQVVEAFACGTPVVNTASVEARSLFTRMPGRYLVPNRDADAVDAAIDAAIGVQDLPAIAGMAHERFSTGVACQAKLRSIRARMLNFTACRSGI